MEAVTDKSQPKPKMKKVLSKSEIRNRQISVAVGNIAAVGELDAEYFWWKMSHDKIFVHRIVKLARPYRG